MNPTTRAVRRLAGAVTFAAVAGGLALPMLATPAGAVEDTTTRRLEGTDRYGTAAAVAADTFPGGADSVVLATGEEFADALAANGLAGALDAPVLLTLRDQLPDDTIDALAELDPTTVYVMGGVEAVSQAVEDELASDYTVERVQGVDRYETAAAAGAAIAGTDDGVPVTDDGVGSTSDGVTAVLASGVNFPDAVSGGGIAFAGRLPVLLTAPDDLPDATTQALEDLGIEHVLVLGGSAAVSDDIVTALEGAGYTTERLAGADRWATNAAVNEYAAAELGFGGATAYLSTGLKFADALAGGPAAGANTAPLVLTAPTVLPAPAQQYLADNGNALDELVAIGGTAAIADATLEAAAVAAQVGNNQSITVTPTDAALLAPSSSALNSDGARSFEAGGLTPGGTYVIALVDDDTVDADAGTFTAYSLSDEASTSIESVNGTPTGVAGGPESVQEEGEATDEGTLTFVVDGAAADRVVPVVYRDADGDGELTLNGTVPAESFGLGGLTAWAPAEAASDTYDDVGISSLSRDDNYFVAGGQTFLYGSEDRLYHAGTPVTLSEFEGMITPGDRLDIAYQRDAQSSFDVIVDTIPDITTPVASLPEASQPDLVEVTWTASPQPDAVYTVYRDNGDGELDTAIDTVMSSRSASTTRQFSDTSGTPSRYIVLPEGGTSGEPDTRSNQDEAITFLSNEVVPGIDMFGLTDGTTVSANAGLGLLNAGDQWMLHFSRGVDVAANATITVREGTGTPVTLVNNDSSTWVVEGTTVVITLGSTADAAPDVSYGADTAVTGLTGVTDGASNAVPVSDLRDTVLDDDGPELMVESSTCDPGETTCTIAFNEPVDADSAEGAAAYSYSPSTPSLRSLTGVTLADDGRTVTLTFSGELEADDEIRPVGTFSAVEDDDGQASTQASFDFVR